MLNNADNINIKILILLKYRRVYFNSTIINILKNIL